MDLLTFVAWILIVGFFYLLTLLALKYKTIRVVLAIIFFLPFAVMLAFFIFRIPQLQKTEAHRQEFFATWKVGGHRGSAHGDIPENSLEAFSAVKKEGGQLAEMDIQITKDGVPVICHDANTVRVTGVDKDISSMNITEFRALRFLNTNVSLPTFEEAVAHCVANNIMMIWDVKNVDENLLKQFVVQIRTHNLYSKVLVSGFNPIDVYKVKLADPKILTGKKTGSIFYSVQTLKAHNLQFIAGFTWRSWELSTTDESATIPRFTGALNAIAQVLDVLVFGLARSLLMPKFLGSDVIFYHVNDISRFLKSDAASNNIYVAGWTSNNDEEQVWLRDYLNVPFITDNVGTVPH
ncbi:Protein CBG23963 [Caenorhabditis briggsae]|uniref:Protein CBG23963 n=1 Tax=Caenorhabditis briggsae TaxID=6238 RepID=A8WJP1_CAEBR|nr:Protein CBG23963 [Caenorhabditis briggsae]CAP20684.2 Protein CBG23963 [Caenorhabditis briggsae]